MEEVAIHENDPNLVRVVRVDRNGVQAVVKHLREHKYLSSTHSVTPTAQGTQFYVPVSEECNLSDLKHLDILELTHVPRDDLLQIRSTRSVPKSGLETLQTYLRERCAWSADLLASVPAKWIKYGTVVMFEDGASFTNQQSQEMLSAFRDCIDHSIVCLVARQGVVSGELRVPSIRSLSEGASTVTTVIENGIHYEFDVLRIMFAPGNGTERKRMGTIDAKIGEVFVDMFAGLGYFTIPFVKHNKFKLQSAIAIEKNPDSAFYLKRNVVKNGAEIVQVVEGDNRIVAPEIVGKVDRISMGYLPNTRDFLPSTTALNLRALEFAKPEGCILHYHHLCTKAEFRTLGIEHVLAVAKECNRNISATLIDFSKVKSYSPMLFHCVADILVVHDTINTSS